MVGSLQSEACLQPLPHPQHVEVRDVLTYFRADVLLLSRPGMIAMTVFLLALHFRTMLSILCIRRNHDVSMPSLLVAAASGLLTYRTTIRQKLSLYLTIASQLLRKTVFHGNRSETWKELILLCGEAATRPSC